MSNWPQSIAIVSSTLVVIVVPWISYRFSRSMAMDERRFQKRSDTYERLMHVVEQQYQTAFWSYPSIKAEPLSEPTQEQLDDLHIQLMLHASDRVGLLLEEFHLAIKKVHSQSLNMVGIKNASNMGHQTNPGLAAEASIAAEIARTEGVQWARQCRNNLRARVRLELHGSKRRLSVSNRVHAWNRRTRLKEHLG